MSLIPFHRLLIASAIVFCLGFAGWELAAFARTGSTPALLLGAAFALAGVGLAFYLRHLRRFLRLPDGERTGRK